MHNPICEAQYNPMSQLSCFLLMSQYVILYKKRLLNLWTFSVGYFYANGILIDF